MGTRRPPQGHDGTPRAPIPTKQKGQEGQHESVKEQKTNGPLPLPPLDALADIAEEHIPAAITHVAAMQAALAARLAAVPRTPLPKPAESRASAEWLTIKDVVIRLKKSAPTIRRILKRGGFPGARKMGAEWRIPERALRAYEVSCPAA
jgi:predicted DNA-binding transcriptional regulator AlpA